MLLMDRLRTFLYKSEGKTGMVSTERGLFRGHWKVA